jgi:hypothetical protein
MALIGFGQGPFGESPYGGSYYPVETTLKDSFTLQVSELSEEEECRLNVFYRMWRRLNRLWKTRPLDQDALVTGIYTYTFNDGEIIQIGNPSTPSQIQILKKERETNRWISALSAAICSLLGDVNVAIREMCVKSANEFWLDLWGKYFGTPRFSGEPDISYRQRIIAVLRKPKCTRDAILSRITPYLFEEPELIEYSYDGIPFSLIPRTEVVAKTRERARMEIVFKPLEPGDDYFTIDFSYINNTDYNSYPLIPIYGPYIYDGIQVTNYPGGLAVVRKIVDNIKMAGVRVFYRVGNTYIK